MTTTEAVIAEKADAPRAGERAGKHLIFNLGKVEFGIAVLKVKEIIGLQDITAVPRTPAHIKGVLNLRGQVIPVADLRTKFGLPTVEPTPRTSILVVDIHARGNLRMGVIVDAVSEVVNIGLEDVEPAPTLGGGTGLPFLSGIAKVKDKICLLLDIDQAVGGSEQYRLESALN